MNSQLDGWKKAGAKHFGLYDYGEFFHPEAPVFWYYHLVDSLKTFNEKWDFRHCLGENDNAFGPSLVYYNMRSGAMWNPDLDWKKELGNICRRFYGRAGAKMLDYHMFMADCVLKADTWKQTDYSWLILAEYDIGQMVEGRKILEEALKEAGNDKILENRIAIARFGHSYMTLCVAQKNQNPSEQAIREATDAFNLANKLSREYDIRLLQSSLATLQSLYFPPSVGKTLYRLPLQWQFMKDPNDIGIEKQWFKSDKNSSWLPISIDKDWTSQGHEYHGAAWYAVSFQMSVEESKQKEFFENTEKLALLFGAIDGLADIYLDGQKIGEQKKDVGYMWNKSFTIDLPANFNSTTAHTIVIRVSKDIAAAGIWKPVMVVSLK